MGNLRRWTVGESNLAYSGCSALCELEDTDDTADAGDADADADGIFGPQTKQKVIEFQEQYKADILDPWNLEKGTGLVGKTTRAKLNELLDK